MDSWERFNETSLPPTKDFYSKLNLEDISNKDYEHAQTCLTNMTQTLVNIMICMFKLIHFCLTMFLKNLDKCSEIYVLDPSHFLSAPGLVWQSCLKKQM